MWAKIGRMLVKAAVWCFGHADQVIAVATAVKGAADATKKK